MTANSDQRNPRSITLSLLIGLCCFAGAALAFPQGNTRKIVSDDFTNSRPAATSNQNSSAPSGGTTTAPVRKRRTYRLASTSSGNATARQKSPRVTAQLGVTLWRLRPAGSSDGTRQLLREKAANAAWVPERIEAGTLLRDGDRVRVSIESPRAGYLYIVDRDLFSGGNDGEIKLIFPFAGEDNQVAPGRLVELPSIEFDPSYFTARPKPGQVGEMLTLIVTSTPLDLPLSNKELPITRAQLQEWEKLWGGATQLWEMEDGAGESWTAAEQRAAARQGTRQLTRDDPAPQTIYRVSAANNKALLVNVRLRYAR